MPDATDAIWAAFAAVIGLLAVVLAYFRVGDPLILLVLGVIFGLTGIGRLYTLADRATKLPPD